MPAPATCPELVSTALELTERSCEGTDRNQVCYGHFELEADPYETVDEFIFNKPGDTENVSGVRSLRLREMNESAGIWGVALMQVEAALQQGALEDVTFVMFGDVALNNPVELVRVSSAQGMNVRREPSTSSEIIGTLAGGETLIANGRLADNSWIRVRLSEEASSIGWLYTELVNTEGDLDTLNVIDLNDPNALPADLAYGAMQVFYLQTGLDDAPCDEAPNSGLMIQTPEGAAEVTLLMNEVDISLRATAFFQAQPSGDMEVFVLDGTATVESDGVSHTLVPGTSLTIPLDENGAAAGPPTEPEPYDESALQSLPVTLLETAIEVPPALDLPAGTPLNGEWGFAWGVDQMTCDNGEVVQFESDATTVTLNINEDGSSIAMLLTQYSAVGDGVYEAIFSDALGHLHKHTLQVTSFDRINGQAEINYNDIGCVLNVPFTLNLVRVN